MCRLALYVGKGRIDAIKAVFTLMYYSAQHDVIGMLAGIDDNHPDGWGVYYLNVTRGLSFLYKSAKPMYEEIEQVHSVLNLIESTVSPQDNIAVVLHVRAASKGEPLGPEHSHPYVIPTSNGVKIVFAHNGAVLKQKIVEELKLSVDYTKITDSCTLAHAIRNIVEKCTDMNSVIESVKNLLIESMSKFVKTALMTFTLVELQDKLHIIVTSHVKKCRPHKLAYYRLFKVDCSDYTIYCSSTLMYYAHVVYRDQFRDIVRQGAVPLPAQYYLEHIVVQD